MFDRFQCFLRDVPRPVLLGLLLFFCAGVADGVLLPFFPLWVSGEAQIPVAMIGLLFGCYAGGELLATPLIGGLADRIGARPVLIGSSIGVGLGIVALSLAHGTLATALVLLFTGVCESVLHPTIMAAIAGETPAATHRRWFSLVAVSSGAGHVVGPLLGAALALVSLRLVFVVAGGTLLLGGLATWLALPRVVVASDDAGDDDDEEGVAALLPAFRDRRLARLLMWVVLFEVAASWLESVIPLYAHEAGTLGASGVGLLFGYAAALTICLQMPIHHLVQHRSARWLATCAGLATAIGLLVLACSPALVALVVAVSLFALAQMLIGPVVPTAVNALAPPSRRAAYMAASSTAVDLKDSLGPSLGTLLYALLPTMPWLVGIPLVIVASLGLGKETDAAPG